VAGRTIVATRTFTSPTALWLALAGGLATLLVSVRALALRQTTIDTEMRRLRHELEFTHAASGTGEPAAKAP
jgi:hypothetical protein